MPLTMNTRPRLGSAWTLLAAAALPLAGCSMDGPTEGQKDPSGFDEVVYVVRQHTVVTGDDVEINVAGGVGQVMDYGRYMPGARIEVRNVETRDVRNLLEGKEYANADVEGMDLSFDAKKVVFAMKLDGNDHYHIYTANLAKGDEAGNPYGVRKLTDGVYDDLAPIWLGGGMIAFVTNQAYTQMGTRADEYNHARAVTQVATISEVGGDADRKVCSQNLSHTFNPFRLANGQVGYSRWEHLENVNDSKLFAMNPDCTQMIALSGQHDKPSNSLVQVVETQDANVFIAVATTRENTLQAGSLVKIDARASGNDQLHDEERSTYQSLSPGVPMGEEGSSLGRYRSPHMLPDGRLLVSWAPGTVNEINEFAMTPPDFGVYIYNPATRKNELVFNAEDTWELYAQPVAKHVEPPPTSSIQTSDDLSLPVTLGALDIRQTSLGSLHGNTVTGAQFDGTPIDQALAKSVKVRIIEGFSSEGAPNVTMFGLTMAEGASLLGEAKVQTDGSWRAEIPPYIPVHLQAVDEFDLAIRNQTTWIQGMPGERRVCGGCHEERTAANLPGGQQLPSSTKAENFMTAIADRVEYPWAGAAGSPNEIQKILSAKCAECHNGTTNGSGPQEFYTVTMTDEANAGAAPVQYRIPRLDLSETPVTVTYDRMTASYPSSYVSIFYPAALDMEMGRVEVTGTVPPRWGVPSDARNSKLIEKLNVTSVITSSTTAWTLNEPYSDTNIHGTARTMHPEDVGRTLTREERVALIRAFDMGGQYYSRQNTGFQPYSPGGTNGPGTVYP